MNVPMIDKKAVWNNIIRDGTYVRVGSRASYHSRFSPSLLSLLRVLTIEQKGNAASLFNS